MILRPHRQASACIFVHAFVASTFTHANTLARMSIFITGTDTCVGKTRVAALLVRALRAAGTDAVGFKARDFARTVTEK